MGSKLRNWIITQLKSTAEIILGQSPESSTYNNSKNGLAFYQGKTEFGEMSPSPAKWCTKPKKIAEKGDVLISVRAPVGPTNICDQKACIGRGLAAIRGLGGIENRFILYFLRSVENKLAEKSTGTTFKAISGDVLRNQEISLPPLPEQRRIVSKIEELFTKLDAGLGNLRKIQKEIKRYRQAVLKYAFEGKLTKNPDIWEEKLIKEVFTLIDGDRGKNYPKKTDFSDNGYCLFLSTKNVRPDGFRFEEKVFITKEKHEKLRGGKLNRGDIVLTTRGTVGNVALYDDSVSFDVIRLNSGMLIFRANAEDIVKKFMVYFIQSPLFLRQIKEKVSGTAQPQLPSGVLKEFRIKLPKPETQQKIVEEIERLFSVADEVEEVIEKCLKEAERLRQSILKIAFEGRLVPQDTNDEPAEKLLERIRKEKEVCKVKAKTKQAGS